MILKRHKMKFEANRHRRRILRPIFYVLPALSAKFVVFLIAILALSAAATSTRADTVTFCMSGCDYNGSSTDWDVPAGVTSITVKAWGGGGGAGTSKGVALAGDGGGGGFATDDISVC